MEGGQPDVYGADEEKYLVRKEESKWCDTAINQLLASILRILKKFFI